MFRIKHYFLICLSVFFCLLLISCTTYIDAPVRVSPTTMNTIHPTPMRTPVDNDTTLPEYIGGKIKGPFKSTGDTVVYNVDETTIEHYDKYIEVVKQKGFKSVLSNVMNGNMYNTFTKLDKLIHICYIAASSRTIIVYESVGALPNGLNKSINLRNKKYPPLLTQIKLESKDMLEGMSYIFRLSDGTFFLIDGGWIEKDHVEAKKLYDLLLEQAEGKEIIIRGWLLTHCHSDHIGTFNDFVEQYHDKVTIEQVLFNFPTDEDILASECPHMLDDHKGRYTNFKRVVKEYLKKTAIVKPHSGYKFSYVDAEIEILQTLEDFYPQTIRDIGMNSSSIIFTVTIAGQRMIFLADATVKANEKLVKNFGPWLKSDMMQVAHHGVSGGTIEVYEAIDAEYILYPAPVSFYKDTHMYPHNQYFLNDSKTVKQVFTMGFGQFTLKLPYKAPEDAEKIPGNIYDD